MSLQHQQQEILAEVMNEQVPEHYRAYEPPSASTKPFLSSFSLMRVTPQNDVEVHWEMFEGIASACGWLREEWGLCIHDLLMGEAQMAVHGVPARLLDCTESHA